MTCGVHCICSRFRRVKLAHGDLAIVKVGGGPSNAQYLEGILHCLVRWCDGDSCRWERVWIDEIGDWTVVG